MKSNEADELFVAMLHKEADATHTPLSGTIELLPLCNMNCKMCYVHQTKEEMETQGRMLTCDEWLHIAKEACEEGMLYLLLTGGEPLLYPDFKRLYQEISQMGVVMQVNTNGTLIDEEWADFFCESGVRRLNITLYGADDAAYGALCGNPSGFTQVMRAASLLKERNVPFIFNCSLTPDNIGQLPELHNVATSLGVPFSPGAYMFPSIRRGITRQEQYRLTPEQAAMAEVYGSQLISAEDARAILDRLKQTPRLKKEREGFSCHAGHSDFSINWKGELLPCIVFQEPKISLLGNPFKECWNCLVDTCAKLPKCQKCMECELQNVCTVCPANCYSETGSTGGCPDYLCQMTEYGIREIRKIAGEE